MLQSAPDIMPGTRGWGVRIGLWLVIAGYGCSQAASREIDLDATVDAHSRLDADGESNADEGEEAHTALDASDSGDASADLDGSDLVDGSSSPMDGSVVPPPAESRVRWARSFPILERGAWGFGSTAGASVAASTGGDLFFAGTLGGPADVGGGRLDPPEFGPCTDTSGTGAVLGRYRSTGEHVWSRALGDVYTSSAQLIATTPTDDIVVVGTFQVALEIDGVRLDSPNPEIDWFCPGGDVFIARFRGTDGRLVWSRAWRGARIAGIVADGPGDVVVFGQYDPYAPVDLGGGPLTDDGLGGFFVAKLSGDDGAHIWSRGFPTPVVYTSWGSLVVLDDAGDVLVSGATSDSVDLGGGLLPDGGGVTMFAAKLSGLDGTHVWSRSFFVTGPGQVIPSSAAAVAGGDMVITGWTWDAPVDFGGGAMPAGRPATFTVRLAGSDGSYVWSRALGGRAVAASADGESMALVGSFSGLLDCGGATLVGPTDPYATHGLVAWMRTSDGSEHWCESFPGDGLPTSVAVDRSDEVSVTGSFQRTMSAGPFSLDPGMGFGTMFLAHLVSGPVTGMTHLSDAGSPAMPASDAGPTPDAAGAPAPPGRMCPAMMTGPTDPLPLCPSPSPPPARGCPGVWSCGDGMIDTTCPGWEEECDRANLGDTTCISLGYAGGTLRCGGDCTFDVSGCQSCPSDDRVAVCTTTAIDAVSPLVLDVDITPDEIAIAWISGPDRRGEVGLRFGRLDHDLRPLSDSGCLARFASPGSYPFVSLARTPSGWLIAASAVVPAAVGGGSALGMLIVPLDAERGGSNPERIQKRREMTA